MPSDPTPNQQPGPNKSRRRPAPALGGNWIWLVVLVVLALFLMNSPLASPRQIHWSDFVYLIEKDCVKEISQVGDKYEGELVSDWEDRLTAAAAEEKKDPKASATEPPQLRGNVTKANLRNGKFSVDRLQGSDEPCQMLLADKVSKGKLDVYAKPTYTGWMTLMSVLLPVLFVLALVFFFLPRFRDPLGGNFLNNYVKSPARRYERNKTRVTFDDVAGMHNAKSELQEIVDFLRN